MTATTYPRADLQTARAIAQLWCPERSTKAHALPASQGSPATDRGGTTSDYLVDACIRNKVPLLSLLAGREIDALLEHRPELGWMASAPFRQAVEIERVDWFNTRREYLQVQGAFDSEGIRAVLIKSAGLRPSLPYRSDNLDVLIDPHHDRTARGILLDLGYIEVTNVEEPLKFLFRKFHMGESISAIHLHESVGWGTGFMDDAAVLADARPAPDDRRIWIPAPEDSILITMAHAFYEDKEIKLGDIWKVVHLLREHDLDWGRVERQASGRGWADGLHTCILLWSSLEKQLCGEHSFPVRVVEDARHRAPGFGRHYLQERLAEQPNFPFSISFRFSKRLYYGKVLRDPALPSRQKAVDITRHTLAGFKRRLPTTTQPAMLVTLSGIDGSGKTVHAQALCQALKVCEIDARVVWMRGGSSPLADRVIGWVKPWLVRGNRTTRGVQEGATLASDTREAKVVRKSAWLRRPLLRVGWMSLVAVDLLLTCFKQVAWPLARGRVIVCDRYVHDALIEMAALGGDDRALRGWAAKALRALCPHPHQAYLLDVSPEHALARKPEEVISFLAQQSSLYHQVAAAWGLYALDTNMDEGASIDHLVHRVLREYYRDWHTLLAALFWANPLHHEVAAHHVRPHDTARPGTLKHHVET